MERGEPTKQHAHDALDALPAWACCHAVVMRMLVDTTMSANASAPEILRMAMNAVHLFLSPGPSQCGKPLRETMLAESV